MARWLLSTRPVLRTLWVTCVLTVASATALAQSAPTPTTASAVATAQTATTGAEQKVNTLVTQRTQLATKLAQQVAAVDSLKKQKASWRRDRELNSAQATANDTATKLTALDKQLAAARTVLATARTKEVVAIDAELATATSDRATQLKKLRVQLAPPAIAPKKIVIPSGDIDPLADPEDLEAQAAQIADAEKQLEQARTSLDKQHTDLVAMANLREAHERAGELSTRDDDQPHRGAPHGSSKEAEPQATGGVGNGNDSAGGSPAPGTGGGAGQGSGSGGGSTTGTGTSGGDLFDSGKSTTTVESNAAVALGEVIDRLTIDGMLRASRSGDPKQRAEAAAQARDAVAKRLEQLKKQRAMIEARAKALRKAH